MGLFDFLRKKNKFEQKSVNLEINIPRRDVPPIILGTAKGENIDARQAIRSSRKSEDIPNTGHVELKPSHKKTYQQVKNFNNYIVLDTETTGLDRDLDRIVQIAIAIVDNGEISEEFETLINPGFHIPEAATAINHITDSDVKDAPKIEDVIPKILDMIGDRIVVGHNISFDLAFLSYAIEKSGRSCTIAYADTLSTAKQAVNLPNYKLETIAKYFGVLDEQSHQALDDVRATNAILRKSIDLILKTHDEQLRQKREERAAQDAERRIKYKNSPLLDKTFVFTGKFELRRENLEGMLTTVGALLRDRPTGKTNYIVVGDTSDYPEWAISRKLGRVDELIADGKAISKISEQQYVQMIYSARDEIRRTR